MTLILDSLATANNALEAAIEVATRELPVWRSLRILISLTIARLENARALVNQQEEQDKKPHA